MCYNISTTEGVSCVEAPERYYRRAYNAIDKLISFYKSGYNKERILEFREKLKNEYVSNQYIIQSEINSIILTIMISLLGLNKEAMEHTGKIIEYKKCNNSLDLSNEELGIKQKLRLKEFNDSRLFSTDFDDWLSIKLNPNKDNSNADYLRRVRNSLLHSNFCIDDSMIFFPFTKLKTKSYYEAELFNLQFQLFIFEYFSNIDSLGLSEAIYMFNVPKYQIKNKSILFKYLLSTSIDEITYKNLKSIGIESPELYLKESCNKDLNVNVKRFVNKLKNTKNVDDIKIRSLTLNFDHIIYFDKYINKTYGKNFYKLDSNIQSGIISTHLKYELNSKTEISNWMIHFYYLLSSINNPDFQISFFDGDEFGIDSCYPALMILKSYLLMYRLQNDNFDEIDYQKVNFDIDDSDIYLYSDTVDKSIPKENYFKKIFDKEYSKGIIENKKEI